LIDLARAAASTETTEMRRRSRSRRAVARGRLVSTRDARRGMDDGVTSPSSSARRRPRVDHSRAAPSRRSSASSFARRGGGDWFADRDSSGWPVRAHARISPVASAWSRASRDVWCV